MDSQCPLAHNAVQRLSFAASPRRAELKHQQPAALVSCKLIPTFDTCDTSLVLSGWFKVVGSLALAEWPGLYIADESSNGWIDGCHASGSSRSMMQVLLCLQHRYPKIRGQCTPQNIATSSGLEVISRHKLHALIREQDYPTPGSIAAGLVCIWLLVGCSHSFPLNMPTELDQAMHDKKSPSYLPDVIPLCATIESM